MRRPGPLNTVVQELRCLLHLLEVWAFEGGYEGLAQGPWTWPASYEKNVYQEGGTLLGTSRPRSPLQN